MAGSFWTDRARISLKTHIVLELVDNFTNQLIRPCRMQFLLDGTPTKATRNKNGLLVFCNLLDVPTQISIQSDLYQERHLNLSDEEKNRILSGTYVHKQIRLEPSKAYSIPSWGTVIEGTIENVDALNTSSTLECTVEDAVDRFRVKKMSESGSEILIHITNNDIMIGRQFYDSDAHVSEAFTVTDVEEDRFKVEPKLSGSLEAHAVLQEVKTIYVNNKGRFMIIYPKVSGDIVPFKLYKDKQKIGEFQIKTNKWNDLGIFTI